MTKAPTQSDLADFRLFCQQATAAQLANIYRKERDARRMKYAEVAASVAADRGLEV